MRNFVLNRGLNFFVRHFAARATPACNGEEHSPFFIIGSGRSGNTLLRNLIMSHSMTYIPPETYVLGKVIRTFKQNPLMAWVDLVHIIAAHFEYEKEFRHFPIESLRDFVLSAEQIDPANRSLASLLDCLYRYFGECNNIEFEQWGDKTPMNTYSLNEISLVFPSAKYIYIYRDGCDVVASYVKSGIYNNITHAAKRWVSANKDCVNFRSRHPSNVHTVSYEELVKNPKIISDSIIDFLGVSRRKNVINLEEKLGDVNSLSHHANVLKPIDGRSIGKGRAFFSDKEMLLLSKIMDNTLLTLGYRNCLDSANKPTR